MQVSEGETTLGNLELCLDFTDTVDWRTSDHARDRVRSYGDLVDWSQRKEIIDDSEATRLRRLAKEEGVTAEKVLGQAVVLREAIYRMFSASAHGKRAAPKDIGILNGYLGRAMGKMEVQATGDGYRLGWCTDKLADKMLYPIAKSAAELLTSERLERVRECANEEDGCGSLFVDCSKSHSRKWCSMDSCGNKVKLRTYYRHHKK